MGIKLIKKGGSSLPPAAEVVKDKPEGTTTTQQTRDNWANFPPPNAKATECAYCHRMYIRTCTEDNHKACGNWWALEKARLLRNAGVSETQIGEPVEVNKDIADVGKE